MFMNKLLILLMAFVASLVFALPEDASNLLKLRRSQLLLMKPLGLMSLVVMQKLGRALFFCLLNLYKCKQIMKRWLV